VVDHPKNIYVGEKVHVYDVVHKVACLVEKKNVGRVVTDSQLKVSEKSIKNRNGSDELRAIHPGFQSAHLSLDGLISMLLGIQGTATFWGRIAAKGEILLFGPPANKKRVLIGKRLSFGGFKLEPKLQNGMQTGSRLIPCQVTGSRICPSRI